MMKIEDVIIKTFLSAEFHVSAACRTFKIHRGNCFGKRGLKYNNSLKLWCIHYPRMQHCWDALDTHAALLGCSRHACSTAGVL